MAVLDLAEEWACWAVNASTAADPGPAPANAKAASKSAAGPEEDRQLQRAAARVENYNSQLNQSLAVVCWDEGVGPTISGLLVGVEQEGLPEERDRRAVSAFLVPARHHQGVGRPARGAGPAAGALRAPAPGREGRGKVKGPPWRLFGEMGSGWRPSVLHPWIKNTSFPVLER